MEEPFTEAARRRAIAWAIALSKNTALAPDSYEEALLESYAQGAMSLDQVLAKLESDVQHVLYHSQATHVFSEAQLLALLEESRRYNERYNITGLLCYSAGHFVQLLEGSVGAVHRLYTKIQQDPRHQQVVTLHDAPGSMRLFTDWRMAFVTIGAEEWQWVLSSLEAPGQGMAAPPMPVADPHLLTLLQVFSNV